MRVWAQYATRRFSIFRPRYLLHVKGDTDDAELQLLRRHRMFGDELFLGRAATDAERQAESRFDLALEVDGYGRLAMRKRRQLRREGLALAWFAARRETRCSVGELLAGKSFVAHDVVELSETENGIVKAVKALKQKLEKLAAYDQGTEWASEPEADPDATAGPAEWMRRARD